MGSLIRWTERTREQAARESEVMHMGRIAAAQLRGAQAMAVGTMELLVELDEERRSLSKGDPALSVMLVEVQATFVRMAGHIQAHMYDRG